MIAIPPNKPPNKPKDSQHLPSRETRNAHHAMLTKNYCKIMKSSRGFRHEYRRNRRGKKKELLYPSIRAWIAWLGFCIIYLQINEISNRDYTVYSYTAVVLLQIKLMCHVKLYYGHAIIVDSRYSGDEGAVHLSYTVPGENGSEQEASVWNGPLKAPDWKPNL